LADIAEELKHLNELEEEQKDMIVEYESNLTLAKEVQSVAEALASGDE
jgi:hypothetical protein